MGKMAIRVLTADDVIRAGACANGVYTWIYRHGLRTGYPVKLALRYATVGHDDDRYIRLAAGLIGYGYGYGDDYGYGYGDGDGDGDGDGYGDGYGDGDDGNGDGGFKP